MCKFLDVVRSVRIDDNKYNIFDKTTIEISECFPDELAKMVNFYQTLQKLKDLWYSENNKVVEYLK